MHVLTLTWINYLPKWCADLFEKKGENKGQCASVTWLTLPPKNFQFPFSYQMYIPRLSRFWVECVQTMYCMSTACCPLPLLFHWWVPHDASWFAGLCSIFDFLRLFRLFILGRFWNGSQFNFVVQCLDIKKQCCNQNIVVGMLTLLDLTKKSLPIFNKDFCKCNNFLISTVLPDSIHRHANSCVLYKKIFYA